MKSLTKVKATPNFKAGKLSKKSELKFIDQLANDYPQFKFEAGDEDHWSAQTKTVFYNPKRPAVLLRFSVLHELAHALLGHTSYDSDFQLLKLESEAWKLATEIGHKYHVTIDDNHVQNCLDTYRDWLHKRSACPNCGTHVLQLDAQRYHCYNCQTSWRVSTGRFARPYRRRLQRNAKNS